MVSYESDIIPLPAYIPVFLLGITIRILTSIICHFTLFSNYYASICLSFDFLISLPQLHFFTSLILDHVRTVEGRWTTERWSLHCPKAWRQKFLPYYFFLLLKWLDTKGWKKTGSLGVRALELRMAGRGGGWDGGGDATGLQPHHFCPKFSISNIFWLFPLVVEPSLQPFITPNCQLLCTAFGHVGRPSGGATIFTNSLNACGASRWTRKGKDSLNLYFLDDHSL